MARTLSRTSCCSKPREDFYADRHPEPSDILLVIEVSDSSLRFDRGRKLEAYAEAGLPDYWLANVPDGVLEVRRDPRPDRGEYGSLQTLDKNQRIAPLAFPDIELAVAELLGA